MPTRDKQARRTSFTSSVNFDLESSHCASQASNLTRFTNGGARAVGGPVSAGDRITVKQQGKRQQRAHAMNE